MIGSNWYKNKIRHTQKNKTEQDTTQTKKQRLKNYWLLN